MPRNSSGTYSLPAGNPVSTATVIASSWANDTMSDLASSITDSLSRSGEGGMLAALKVVDGTAGAPGITWGTETTAGWYRAGSGDFRFSIGGAAVVTVTAAGISDGSLSSNVPLKNANNTFTGNTQTIAPASGDAVLALTNAAGPTTGFISAASAALNLGTSTNHSVVFYSNNTNRGNLGAGGNWTLVKPGSGTTLTVNGAQVITDSTGVLYVNSSGGVSSYYAADASVAYFGTATAHPLQEYTNNTQRRAVSASGNHTLFAPSSGTTLTLNSTTGNYSLLYTDSTVSGVLGWISGTTAYQGTISNHGLITRTNNADRHTITGAGNHTIHAPSSGTTVTASGASAQSVYSASVSGNGIGYQFTNGTSTGVAGYFVGNTPYFGTLTNHPAGFLTNNTTRGYISAAGEWVFGPPSSGVTVAVVGINGNSAQTWHNGTIDAYIAPYNAVSAVEFGTTSNHGLNFVTNNVTAVRIGPTQGMQLGSPTGGDKGAGTLNTAGAIYQNNVPLYETGSFTATLSGFSSSTTGTIQYTRMGNLVMMYAPSTISGTSNTTSLSISSGVPAGLVPVTGDPILSSVLITLNSGVATLSYGSWSGGTIAFSPVAGGGYTASGAKGIAEGSTFIYRLN